VLGHDATIFFLMPVSSTIGSPKVLELSGIGDPAVLKPLVIPVVVNLPGVGNNAADHMYFGASFGG
jgi:choline dehydrogenase-like flavoprotein